MKVLIADDEPDVRLGLETIVSWQSLGFSVCGEAANGTECLEKILALQPDLVLLDIRMPKMHGLACAKEARAMGWNGKIIILSGYSDFQYAKDAITCGVESYLLKPIDEEELSKAVEEIRRKILRQRMQYQKMNLCVEKARGTVLLDLLSGRDGYREETDPAVNLKELSLDAEEYRVVMADGSDARVTDGFIQSAGLKQNVDTVKYPGRNVYLFRGSGAAERFQHQISVQTDPKKISAFFAFGRAVYDPSEICVSCRDAEAVFERRFFFPRGVFWAGREALPQSPDPFVFHDADLHDYAEQLFALLQAGNAKGMTETLDALERKLETADAMPGYVADFLINICLQVKHKYLESFGENTSGVMDDTDVVSRLYEKRRLYEVMDSLREEFGKMFRGMEQLTGEHITDRVLRFIDTNYSKNLKLETIASSFGYSSAYLGKILKEKTGESFNSYLDRLRIEKAKELLGREDLKVCEISRKIGYENIDYFYYKFRKYLGQSPNEYRKSLT